MSLTATLLAAMVLTNLTDVSDAIHTSRIGERFALEGTVLLPGQSSNTLFVLTASTQCMTFRDVTDGRLSTTLSPGNIVRAVGAIALNENGLPAPNCDGLSVLDPATAPPPPKVSSRDLRSGRFDNRLVQICGEVRQTFRDEIDPKYIRLTLTGDGTTFQATCCDDKTDADNMRRLVGAEVRVTGVYFSAISGFRELFGKAVNALSPAAIHVMRPAPPDPFSVPPVDTATPTSPDEVAILGRLRSTGRVIAVWQKHNVLIRDLSGKVRKITLEGGDAPACGAAVEVVGTPETDLYRINLSDAIWRPYDGDAPATEPPVAMSAADLLTDGHGNYKINPTLHGRAVRLDGVIVNLPGNDPAYGIMTIKSGDFAIPVDISANRGIADELSVGCRVAVSGTCIVETEAWSPYSAMPRATGVTIVLRTPADVSVISQPSWLTPQKSYAIVGALLLAFLGIAIWNRALQRMVADKSRELFEGQIDQMLAVLRVDERTRLAVELHDSLSQNLSGVACQIAAAKGSLPAGADSAASRLATAERMLLSCRTELRRCLWDLRGDALEDPDFEAAIKKTLAPVAVGTELHISFNVPRALLSDTTAHAVICVIRELVSNAVRHGEAKSVHIDGEFHDSVLSFSVRDDGCGFDLKKCEGPAEGHFGLEGIRERMRRLGGEFKIESVQGRGTRAEVTLVSTLPAEESLEKA